MPTTSLQPVRSRLPRLRLASRVAGALALCLSSLAATDRLQAAIVSFPVNSGGSITQPGTGQQPVEVAFGNINLGAGTFSVASTFGSGTSFGIGLNPPEAGTSLQFYTASNNSIGWLVSAGTVSLLTAGNTVGGAGSYTGSDPNFGADWRAGVSPGYAGLRMTSGSDVYYGWASINYVLGSPNQATVTAFAFENQPNTPITVAAVPEPSMTLAVEACTVGLAAMMFRRRRNDQNS